MATKTSNSGGFPVELPHVEVDGVATGQPEASIGGLWLHNVAHKMWIVVPGWPAEHSGAAKANHQWFRIMDSISLLGRIWDQNTSLLNKGVVGRPTRSKFKINWNEFAIVFIQWKKQWMFGHFQSFWIHFQYFYVGLGGQGPNHTNHTKRTKPKLATFMASTAPGWDLSLNPPKKSWVCPFQNTEVIEDHRSL